MKIILALVTILIMNYLAFAQSGTWYLQQSPRDNALLCGVDFANDSVGMAVAVDRDIFQTTNGGTQWTIMGDDKPFFGGIRGVKFIPDSTWVVYGRPCLRKSVNFGSNWSNKLCDTNDSSMSILSCSFANENLGAYCTAWNEIFLTKDGGYNWQKLSTPDTLINSWVSVSIWSPEIVMVSSYDGSIIVSQNLGLNWIVREVDDAHWEAGKIIDDSLMIVVGQLQSGLGVIYRSSDTGLTWNESNPISGTRLNSVDFTSSLEGIAVGANGIILFTEDAGVNWERQLSPTSADLFGISYPSKHAATAVGTHVILRMEVDSTTDVTNRSSDGQECSDARVMISPNPASDYFIIRGCHSGNLQTQISIFTQTGLDVGYLNPKINVHESAMNECVIDTTLFPSGVYCVSASTSEKSELHMVTIIH